jgi:hypothetical protein
MIEFISNTDAYILNRLNELAALYGLRPYELDVTLDRAGHLKFNSTPTRADLAERLDRLRAALSLEGYDAAIGDAEAFIERLDRAVAAGVAIPPPGTRTNPWP